MANKTTLLAAFLLLLSAMGCDEPQADKMYMPAGAPTQSVRAYCAFNDAKIMLRLNRYKKEEQAIELFTRAIEADPKFAEAYYNRGLTYAELRNIEKAEEDLASLERLGSDKSETLEKVIAVARDSPLPPKPNIM